MAAVSDVEVFQAPPAGDNRYAQITDNVCARHRSAAAAARPGTSRSASRSSMLGAVRRQRRLGVLDRHRRLGQHDPGRLGLSDRQLRVLGRYRPRRHADQRDPVPAPPELAHRDQPLRRGDDDLRGHLRRHLPGHPHRPPLAAVLDVPDPEPDGDVAAVPQPARVGHLRGRHLRHDVAPVLVHGHDSGPRDVPRSLDHARSGGCSTGSSRWAGAARRASGTATSART